MKAQWFERARISLAVGLVLCGASACSKASDDDEDDFSTTAGSSAQPMAGASAGSMGSSAGMGAAGTTNTSTSGSGGNNASAGSGNEGTAGAAGTDGNAEGGTGGDDQGGAGTDAAGDGGMPATRPPCLDKPSQLVLVGDSYMNYEQNLNNDLSSVAVADGALQSGQQYRMYALPGASMASGGIAGFIPDQLDLALMEDPDIIASVMTGGGNDLLIADPLLGGSDCINRTDSPMVKECQDVVKMAIDKAAEMMNTAAEAGVRHVIYFFYPHLPGGGFGGENPNYMLDYSYPLAEDLCTSAQETTGGKLTCYFIDLRPVFEGMSWIADDFIHPTAEGSAAIADAVYAVMKEQCIGQPESSGCCEP